MSRADIPPGKISGGNPGGRTTDIPDRSPPDLTSRISAADEASLTGPDQPSSSVPETLSSLGRYQVLGRLGQGGMGSVWLAQDTQLQRKVALKIPQIPDDNSREWIDRFYREARAAATIHHSHLCPVYDVGEIDGVHFITMAYIEGEPLSAQIAKRPEPWPVSDAAILVRKLAVAIHVAHQHGIVHRDLKPANIMINLQGEPVIVDFGLARRTDTEDETITRLGELCGTPAYMSPEQVAGEPEQIGPLSDLYSLGVIFFELLTRRRPFQGKVAAVLAQILRDAPPPPSTFRSGLDARVEGICCRLLAREPASRYATGLALSEALDEYLKLRQSAEFLPPPLREPARPIVPPPEDADGYNLTEAAVADLRGLESEYFAVTDDPVELGERITEFLVTGQVTKVLAACQDGGDEFCRSAEGSQMIRQAFTDAINQKLQARDFKSAVSLASALHGSVLPVESADLLAKTLSAVGRMLWSDDDPGPALQLWQKYVDKFSNTALLAEKAANFAYNRGVALEKGGKFGTAVALYKLALNYDPDNSLVRKRLESSCLYAALNEVKKGRLEPALTICDESLQALPGNEALLRLRDQIRVRMMH
jgi:serine/threonine protein kinase